MVFADLIAPVPVDGFLTGYWGRRPLHIPAGAEASRKGLLSWGRLNELLTILPHWTEENLKLIMNSRAVQPHFYMDEVDSGAGLVRRANPAKVDVFLAMGASLVANAVEEISSEIRAATAALGEQFSARAGANAYCSFQAVQAFPSHSDLHEVFALHCEGEKVWRIYENRAEAPVTELAGEDAQQIIDRAKGKMMMEVRMRPGDLLYIPRGYYHDALASSEASLHLTFSVAPLTGRGIFRQLEELSVQDPLFRHYLPDARAQDGVPLRRRLQEMAEELAALMVSEEFLVQLEDRQRRLREPVHSFTLPARQKLEFYARTEKPASLSPGSGGLVLSAAGETIELRHLGSVAEWLLTRPAFSVQELLAGHRHLAADEIRRLVQTLERLGIVQRYSPRI